MQPGGSKFKAALICRISLEPRVPSSRPGTMCDYLMQAKVKDIHRKHMQDRVAHRIAVSLKFKGACMSD